MQFLKQFFLTVLAMLPLHSHGAALDVADIGKRLDLLPHMQYAYDAAQQLTAAQVASADGLQRPTYAAMGATAGTHWLRATLHNGGAHSVTLLLETGTPLLDQATLFSWDGVAWQATERGLASPPDAQHRRLPLFSITLAPGESQQLMLRLAGRTPVNLGTTLWHTDAYWEDVRNESSLMAGLLFAMLALEILLLAMPSQPGYTRYWELLLCIPIIMLLMGISSGLVRQHVQFPHMADLVGTLLILKFPLTIALCNRISKLPKLRPRLAGTIWRIQWAACLLLQVLAWRFPHVFLPVFGLFCTLAIARYIAIGFWLRRQKLPGWHTLLALCTICVGMTVIWVIGAVPGIAAPSPVTRMTLLLLLYGAIIGTLKFSWSRSVEQMYHQAVQAKTLLTVGQHVDERTAFIADALRTANHANWAKSALFARVNHELRAPLHSILGYAQLLRHQPGRISAHDAAAVISDAGQRLLHLISELLELNRCEVGQLRIAPQPLDWGGFTKQLSAEIELLGERSNNRSEVRIVGPQPDWIMLDAVRLRQVLDNLLSNAHRHTQQGQVTLLISSDMRAGRLRFEIADTGCGIAPQRHARLFEPFCEGASGIGLGLSISAQIVKLLGGQLELAYSSPRGTCFSFEVGYLAAEPHRGWRVPTGYAGARRTVLLVDPDAGALSMLSQSLSLQGFEVRSARSSQQALALLCQQVQLVITELELGDDNGWNLLAQIRLQQPACPVVLLSTRGGSSMAHQDNWHFDLFLRKPIEYAMLLQHLGTLLDLEWHYGDDDAVPANTGVVLPAPQLALIKHLTELGLVTDLLHWCDEFHRHASTPQEHAFAEEVASATRRLDFGHVTQVLTHTNASPRCTPP